jgi:hypothetical protein
MSIGQESALFSPATLSANGSTTSMTLPSAGLNLLEVYLGTGATFGSGTVTVQSSPDGGTTWVTSPIGTATFTSGSANTLVNRFFVYGPVVRFTLAGATSPSLDIRAIAKEVREPRGASASAPNSPSIGAPVTFAFTANATSATIMVPSYDQSLVTDVAVAASGTFGSGTLTLQTSPDGGTTWFAVGTAVTAAGYITVGTPLLVPMQLTANTHRMFRLVLTGATSPAISARVIL